MSERTPMEALLDVLMAACDAGDEDVVEVRFDPRAWDGGLAIHPRREPPERLPGYRVEWERER